MKTTHKITISTVFGSVLWESDKDTIKEAVVEKYGRNANLRDANLRDANLRDADLYGTNLRGANLYGANLRDADMRGTNLRGADMRDADMRGTNLRGADLYGADLYGADMRDANLRDADLYGTNLRGTNLRDANLYGADMRDADMRGTNLRGAELEKLPTDFINQCSRDILFILGCLKNEVPALRKMLIEGKVDGSQYEGECACLIGSLANADGGMKKVCAAIPFYEKGTHNMGETFFLNIRKGDTPETNSFSKHAVMLCDMVLSGKV